MVTRGSRSRHRTPTARSGWSPGAGDADRRARGLERRRHARLEAAAGPRFAYGSRARRASSGSGEEMRGGGIREALPLRLRAASSTGEAFLCRGDLFAGACVRWICPGSVRPTSIGGALCSSGCSHCLLRSVARRFLFFGRAASSTPPASLGRVAHVVSPRPQGRAAAVIKSFSPLPSPARV